jgi:hypothetical protein
MNHFGAFYEYGPIVGMATLTKETFYLFGIVSDTRANVQKEEQK